MPKPQISPPHPADLLDATKTLVQSNYIREALGTSERLIITLHIISEAQNGPWSRIFVWFQTTSGFTHEIAHGLFKAENATQTSFQVTSGSHLKIILGTILSLREVAHGLSEAQNGSGRNQRKALVVFRAEVCCENRRFCCPWFSVSAGHPGMEPPWIKRLHLYLPSLNTHLWQRVHLES